MPDVTSPEFLGSLSAIGAWRAILRNPYATGSDEAYRWQLSRENALGKSKSKFGTNAGDHDATVKRWSTPAFYDTDEREIA